MFNLPTLGWHIMPHEAPDVTASLLFSIRDNLVKILSSPKNLHFDRNMILSDDISGFCLSFSEKLGENQLCRRTLEGAGEIKPNEGYIPIILFATLGRFMKSNNPFATKILHFCNEQGEEIAINDWRNLETELTRMGIENQTEVRKIAEAVGFMDPIYQLDQLDTNNQSLFF